MFASQHPKDVTELKPFLPEIVKDNVLVSHFAPGDANAALKGSMLPSVFAYKKGVESTSFEQGAMGSLRLSLSGSRTVAAASIADVTAFMTMKGKLALT